MKTKKLEFFDNEILDKLELFFLKRFPNFNFYEICTEEELEEYPAQGYIDNKDGTFTRTYYHIQNLTMALIIYKNFVVDKRNSVENKSVQKSKELCKRIIGKTEILKKELEYIGITYPLIYYAYLYGFSEDSKLVNKSTGYNIKNPLDVKIDRYRSDCFRETLKSYSEIEKSHESILILSAFILNDLIESMKSLEKYHRPRRGNKGRLVKYSNDIIAYLGGVFFKCTGEKPIIKRSGSSLSKKHGFSKMVLDFESEFDVAFNYSYAQKLLESISSFEKPTKEETLKYNEWLADNYPPDPESFE